ncbi:enoyl-CoA hydratase [Parasphingorhabdus halotolerans]|uniref:Enoyl-CoA hydratase n=1 Tax=Parasphingorhabdus halotolerans TaxID=2725558 RepID=A0A6H2DM31_9SPHN|nr:enoyl-CoA hydratase [Parasphingorhabdus halotolerans]QJB68811.1 enoyl-CoA hydratase [Parasphingorhabdus halotolerans]
MSDNIVPLEDVTPVYETDEPILYEAKDGIAWITLNRPEFHNVQNSQMTYALDDAFMKAVDDDAVKCIVLKSDAKHFSAGHDIGSPGRDFHSSFDRRLMWYDHANKAGAEKAYIREQEVYLGMCKRWRNIPKPTIAQVHKGCIAGGLMLAWVCDLIIASDDAFFQDPVLQMGFPGLEYFAHTFELNTRIAKEFLFLGERMSAERAYQMGMLNRVVPREQLADEVLKVATRIAEQPRLALQLAKQACNHMDTLAGKEAGIDASFGYHHFAHANNQLTKGDYIAGFDGKKMAEKNKAQEAKG